MIANHPRKCPVQPPPKTQPFPLRQLRDLEPSWPFAFSFNCLSFSMMRSAPLLSPVVSHLPFHRSSHTCLDLSLTFHFFLECSAQILFNVVHSHFQNITDERTKASILSTYMKFINLFPVLTPTILAIFEQYK